MSNDSTRGQKSDPSDGTSTVCSHNERTTDQNDSALVTCPDCGREGLRERIAVHDCPGDRDETADTDPDRCRPDGGQPTDPEAGVADLDLAAGFRPDRAGVGEDGDDPCGPLAHAGTPAFVVAIGGVDEPVRRAHVCTACGEVIQAVRIDAGHGVLVEGVDATLDRVAAVPHETRDLRVPIDALLDWLADRDDRDAPGAHATDGGDAAATGADPDPESAADGDADADPDRPTTDDWMILTAFQRGFLALVADHDALSAYNSRVPSKG